MSGPRWRRFEWDEANVGHIARHSYTPDEVEEVFVGPHRIRKVGEARWIAYGRTEEGRSTTVVFEKWPGAIRVVTARDMSENERRAFRRSTKT